MIIVAGMPRCGTTLLARAIDGQDDGQFWEGGEHVVKTHARANEFYDSPIKKAIFVYGNICDSAYSSYKKRWTQGHIDNCQGPGTIHSDPLKMDALGLYEMLKSWLYEPPHHMDILYLHYPSYFKYRKQIGHFVGWPVILPIKKERNNAAPFDVSISMHQNCLSYKWGRELISVLPVCWVRYAEV